MELNIEVLYSLIHRSRSKLLRRFLMKFKRNISRAKRLWFVSSFHIMSDFDRLKLWMPLNFMKLKIIIRYFGTYED
jgi:hypothetical protein